MPLLLKGICSPHDARLAVDHGVSGIIVSNHGGRQFGRTISPFNALPAISNELNGCVPILIDGGIRSGRDVFVSLARGADLYCPADLFYGG